MAYLLQNKAKREEDIRLDPSTIIAALYMLLINNYLHVFDLLFNISHINYILLIDELWHNRRWKTIPFTRF